MSLTVSGHAQQAVIFQMMQALAAKAKASAPAPAQPSSATTASAAVASPERGAVSVSDVLAAFLSGLVAGGPASAVSPTTASSAADLQQRPQRDLPTAAFQRAGSSPASTPASDATSTVAGLPSDVSTADLGVVLAAYLSHMPTEEDASSRTTDSASVGAVSHPGSQAQVRDHASPPANISTAAAA